MKAVRFHGVGEPSVDDVPSPTAGPGQVLIEPLAVGLCGTDVHILDGTYPASSPVTLGHEVAGRVCSLGTGVSTLSLGDLVTIEPHRYCGTCNYCRRGLEHMCVRKEAYGVHLDGGMAELMVVPERVAYRLPPSTAPAIGALTEPLGCCVHGMDRLSALSGLPVLIIGTGPAGAILVALARQSSLHPVVAADLREDRRDLAFRMGADVALDPGASDFTERALAITHGDGFAYVVDAVGSPAVLETCLRLSARRATILVFGVAHPDAAAAIRPNEIYTKELTILGTAVNPFTHLRAVDLLASLPLHQLRIASYRLEDALTAMTAVRAGLADKVQIVPNPPSGQ